MSAGKIGGTGGTGSSSDTHDAGWMSSGDKAMGESAGKPGSWGGSQSGRQGAGYPAAGARPGGMGGVAGRGFGRGGGPMMHMQARMMKEKPRDAKKSLKRLFKYIGASKYLLLALLGIVLGVSLFSLAGPALQGRAIDTITLNDRKLAVDFDGLWSILATMGLVYLGSFVLTYFQGILSAKLSLVTVRNMRTDLFAKISSLPISYTDSHQHGDIMSRMTNDVDNISHSISQSIGSLFSGAITIIGTLSIMLYYNPLLTLISFTTIPLSVFSTSYLAKHMRKYFLRQQTLLGQLNGHIEEMVTGYRTVVAFGKENKVKFKFSGISNELKKVGIRAQIFGNVMGPLMTVISSLNYLLIALFGGMLAFRGVITIGIIQAFLIYSRQFTRPINEIANQYAQLQTAMAGAERVFEIMDAMPEVDEGQAEFRPENVKGDILFKDVYFSYKQGEPVLKDFNLSVRKGSKIAIVGATGAGKTTVVNLLTRFYDIDSGSISIDGTDLRDIPKKQLRRSIAIVLQDTVLFSDTIAANIRYGKPEAEMEEVKSAAKMSNADIFVERMKDGYETELTEAGSNLSQGQRQLIAIARAVLADPRILILDEATSSVDTRTEMHIQEAMISLMRNRTSLIIAHRLSTIRDSDMIVVIDDGRIAETGSHDELISRGGTYFKLYQTQFAGIST